MAVRLRVETVVLAQLIIIVVLFIAVVAPSDASYPPAGIPGTRHTTAEEAEAFRAAVECSTRGKWVYNPTPRIIPWMRKPWNGLQLCDHTRHYSKVGVAGPRADTEAITHGNWSVRESLKWEWAVDEPDTCLWEEFNRAEFCRILGPGRSIVILGDSMNLGFYYTMWNNLLVNATNTPEPLFPDGCDHLTVPEDNKMVCEGAKICSEEYPRNPVHLRFIRNSRLGLNRKPEQTMAPFVLDIESWKPDVILINRGAWYTELEVWEEGVRNASAWLRKKFPNAFLIYRDTPPGHVDCTKYKAPLKSRQDPSITPLPHNWGNFAPQNHVAKSLITKYGGLYMDVDTMTSLRPDGHMNDPSWPGKPDCLHYCLPGPLDEWARKLQNILKLALPPPTVKPVWESKGPVLKGVRPIEGIPGSNVRGKEGARKVRGQLDCFGKRGEWQHIHAPVVLPWPRVPYGGLSHCDREHLGAAEGNVAGPNADAEAKRGRRNSVWKVREALKYHWEVEEGECEESGGWQGFDQREFCRLLDRGARVLVVGDSMNLQFTKSILYNAVVNSTGISLKDLHDPSFTKQCSGWRTTASHRQPCYAQNICTREFPEDPVTLRFVQNRVLSLTQHPHEEEAPWMDVVAQWKPTVVILNRGLHFVALPRFLEELEDTLQGLRAIAPDALVVYRNTPTGHVNCVKHAWVMRSPQDFNTIEWSDHWTDIDGQNYLAREVVEAYGCVYMDVAAMTNLRGDGHMGLRGHRREGEMDCVHYCEPGPIDTWVQVLYNILLRIM